MALTIVELGDSHDCKHFKCSENDLTAWLRLHAKLSVEHNYTKVYVAVEDGDPSRVLGYYAYTMGEIRIDELPDDVSPPQPHPLPVVLLARFATDKRFQGRGIEFDIPCIGF